MAKQKRPEQRSASTQPATPDQSAPQPTGEESFQPPPAPEMPPPEEATQDVSDLQALAAEYFSVLTEQAQHLTAQARGLYDTSEGYMRAHPASGLGGAFLTGLLLGFLSSRS